MTQKNLALLMNILILSGCHLLIHEGVLELKNKNLQNNYIFLQVAITFLETDTTNNKRFYLRGETSMVGVFLDERGIINL